MLNRPVVCLVEDYREIEIATTKILEYAGMFVLGASSGAILDSLLGQGIEPDIFLIDLVLPDEDGLQIMRRLRADPRWGGKPMLAMSALSARRDRREALANGFDAFIAKPYSGLKLVEVVELQLGLRIP
ncbi:MAG TPA: response regulator [Candidatus Dormibacteraeota bacterium]|jgi:CheY-like chemotaxis protein|nr:response regulator [Candidatus Dormibacteraeota bacterium]